MPNKSPSTPNQSPLLTRRRMIAGGAIAAIIGVSAGTMHNYEGADRPKPGQTTNVSEKNAQAVEAEARKVAAEINQGLYIPGKGMGVPGIINGTVVVEHPSFSTLRYNNAVILATQTESSADLNGAWVGVPMSNADNRLVLYPIQLNLGDNLLDGAGSESIIFNDPNLPILTDAGIYPTMNTDGGDMMMAFDMTGNGRFPSVVVDVEGSK